MGRPEGHPLLKAVHRRSQYAQTNWRSVAVVSVAVVLFVFYSFAGKSTNYVHAPAEDAGDGGQPGFLMELFMGSLSAAVSKSAAAPIERVKLLMQNQASGCSAALFPRPVSLKLHCPVA